jgi:hypothetical protein
MAWGREEQRSMHEPYWLWQASPLPWADAPDAEMTIQDVSHSKLVSWMPYVSSSLSPQLAPATRGLHLLPIRMVTTPPNS